MLDWGKKNEIKLVEFGKQVVSILDQKKSTKKSRVNSKHLFSYESGPKFVQSFIFEENIATVRETK